MHVSSGVAYMPDLIPNLLESMYLFLQANIPDDIVNYHRVAKRPSRENRTLSGFISHESSSVALIDLIHLYSMNHQCRSSIQEQL